MAIHRYRLTRLKYVTTAGIRIKNFSCSYLLVFTGREDQEKSYLFSSTDILVQFHEHDDDGRTLLRIKGSKLIATNNYQIVQKQRALDRIEHALANADFMSNGRFLSGSSYVKISPDQSSIQPLET